MGLIYQSSAEAAEAALPLAILSLKAKQGHRIEKPRLPSTVMDWAMAYRRIDGRPFSLRNFTPLQAIYEDPHPHIVLIKPAQRGASEFAINYAVFALDRGADVWTHGEEKKKGLNVGYVFPSRDALSDFSKERLTGLEHESFHLERIFNSDDAFNAVTFKQVGTDSYLYLRGGWSSAGLKSFPADVLIRDEYDEIDVKATAMAERRLNASFVRRILDLSTPTIPGRGIHALYLQSDQQVYYQTCVTCGTQVTHDFFRDVIVDGLGYGEWKQLQPQQLRQAVIQLVCPACRVPRDQAERCKPGMWEAQAPEVRSLRGYHLPWWPFPFIDLTELAVKAVSQDPSQIEEFFRQDLGIPYDQGGAKITESMLRALSVELTGGLLPDEAGAPGWAWKNTTMGVDVGTRLHYRISSEGPDGQVYARQMGSVLSFGELEGLMHQYRVRVCVIDSQPEAHAVAAFALSFPGRVAAANYPTGATALKGVLFAPESIEKILDMGRVQVNRTMAMDGVKAVIASGLERWPARLHNDPEVVAHLTSPTRVTVIDAHGQPRADWVHTTPDHLYHACVYDYVARRLITPEAAVATVTPNRHAYSAERRRVL